MGKKKNRTDTLATRLALAIKSGKVLMGTRSSIKALRSGHAQLLVVAHNCPPLRNAELAYYAMISRTPVHNFNGTNTELGTACGKFFRCSALVVMDPGDSDIVEVYGEQNSESLPGPKKSQD